MWHMRIWQATSANDIQHHPRSARISRGGCASDRRDRPWPACIRQPTSFVVCAHRKATSTNGKQHKARHARISRGVCASARRHRRRPTAGSISQRLHASDVACAHMAKDVGQRHVISAKTCTHQSWHVRIAWVISTLNCAHQPVFVGQRKVASAKAFTHLTWHVRI